MIPLKDNIPTLRFPIVTVMLIAANLAVFGWQLSHSSYPGSASSQTLAEAGLSDRDQLNFEYGAVPDELTHPGTYCAPLTTSDGNPVCGSADEVERESGVKQIPWWQSIFSSMFMHGGILHIAFNLLFLWIFGNNVEDSMGRPRFLAFYLLAGIVAAYSQALLEPDSLVPQIGASGAIAGVLGGYLLLYPGARVLTLLIIIFFVTLVEIPATIVLGIWFFLQFLPAVGQVATPEVAGEGGVAYLAHVGGFVFGLLAIRLFANRYRGSPGLLRG